MEWWTNHNSSTFPCMRGPNTRRSFSILQRQAREVTALSRRTYLPTYLRCTCSIQPVWEVFSYPQQSSSLSCWELGTPRDQDGHLPNIPRQVRGHHLSWTHDCESSLIQYITCATIDATRCIRIVPVPQHTLNIPLLGRFLQPLEHHATLPLHTPLRLPRLPHACHDPAKVDCAAPHARDCVFAVAADGI